MSMVDGEMKMQIEYFDLPTHWAVALMYGDESVFEDSNEDFNAYSDFVDEMVNLYGQCWCIDAGVEPFFTYYHDATRFGIGGADCYKYVFDTTKIA